MNPACEISVDGGVNSETSGMCIDAGATILVAGNSVFNAVDRVAAIETLSGKKLRMEYKL
jgi:ribulose-phosphate 3-epimerase